MEITYPFAKVFTDKSDSLYLFLFHNPTQNTFKSIKQIGSGIISFSEMDFTAMAEKINSAQNIPLTEENFEELKRVYWDAVDLIKKKNVTLHFFLNSELLRNFNDPSKTLEEKIYFATQTFQILLLIQYDYRAALEICLDVEILAEYTLAERYVMFSNLNPHFHNKILRSMYAIAPVVNGFFDKKRLRSYEDIEKVNVRTALKRIHKENENPVSMMQYFAVQDLEEMLYLEFMEMVKRGIRVKRCGLCDRYFVLPDKRKREFCDRIYKNKRTCKQVGAKLKYNDTLENDVFLQDFKRIYNKLYSRFYRSDSWEQEGDSMKISQEEFKLWSQRSSEARLRYCKREITGEDLLEITNTIPVHTDCSEIKTY